MQIAYKIATVHNQQMDFMVVEFLLQSNHPWLFCFSLTPQTNWVHLELDPPFQVVLVWLFSPQKSLIYSLHTSPNELKSLFKPNQTSQALTEPKILG